MKKFEIWIEGFYAQGMFVEPRCIVTVRAASFRNACYEHFIRQTSDIYFDHERLMYRGHSLFYKEPKS